MARDYYAVLGIGTAASGVQIRRAYQKLARRYSPDVNFWDREAHTLFEEISQAYRVLGDPSARTLYDRHGGSEAADRGAAGRPAGRRGDPVHVPVELAFDQAANGLDADIVVERLSPCEACGSSGSRPGGRLATCAHCGGAGVVWSGDSSPRTSECPVCAGAGERVMEPCADCRGRGVTPSRAVVRVAIPAGMDTGSQIRIPEEGHAGPFAGPRGDLLVITRVHADPVFTRKGDNLYAEVPVTVAEAILGARVSVRTLLGEVDLAVPPGTQSGQVLRIRGRGLPRLSGEGRGDLYVAVSVAIPRDLDARTQEMIRDLGRLLPPAAATPGKRTARA
jgi:molecular chaperone DnaJ